MEPVRMLRVAGVLAFALTACQYFLVRVSDAEAAPITLLEYWLRGTVPGPLFVLLEQTAIWTLAWWVWRGARLEPGAPPPPERGRLIARQVLLATVTAGDLLPLVAAQVGLLLPGRSGLIWIAAQVGMQLAVCLYLPGALGWMHSPLLASVTGPEALLLSYAWIPVYHLLAYSLGLLGAVEAQQRRQLALVHGQVVHTNRELQRLNGELYATRQMEAESARVAERLTIARELHDALGHHLAALSVHLQLATKVEGPEARQAVDDAYLLTRLLLSDVRHVVTALRQFDGPSLKAAIETMAAGVVRPRVTVNCHDSLDRISPMTGHTLFRCAQEAITNALRHADAEHLRLSLERTGTGYRMCASDDGRGATDMVYGHGLTGMRERVEEIGGRMRCQTGPGAGFVLEIEVPDGAAA